MSEAPDDLLPGMAAPADAGEKPAAEKPAPKRRTRTVRKPKAAREATAASEESAAPAAEPPAPQAPAPASAGSAASSAGGPGAEPPPFAGTAAPAAEHPAPAAVKPAPAAERPAPQAPAPSPAPAAEQPSASPASAEGPASPAEVPAFSAGDSASSAGGSGAEPPSFPDSAPAAEQPAAPASEQPQGGQQQYPGGAQARWSRFGRKHDRRFQDRRNGQPFPPQQQGGQQQQQDGQQQGQQQRQGGGFQQQQQRQQQQQQRQGGFQQQRQQQRQGKHGRHGNRGPMEYDDLPPPVPLRDDLPPLDFPDLQRRQLPELQAMLESTHDPEHLLTLRKHDLLAEILRGYIRMGGLGTAAGVLQVANDGSGFLRSTQANYIAQPDDVYVPATQVRRFNLRSGDMVEGVMREPQNKDKYFVLARVDTVNGAPAANHRAIIYEDLTPVYPDRRILLETGPGEISMRVMDLFTPIGFGQRGLIVAPPRTGKTVLMQKIANAISANHPAAKLFIVLIDERPEEVTDMQRNTKAQVVSSTFDESAERHVQVADMVIEVARRMVEEGQDVVILLDSITRLARAYNTLQPNSGKILSGGVDANALQKPKRFFGAARNIEGGGSLTIIATALVDTGSRMDEVIFEEFKGTGNMELCLDRSLVDKRVFPAINIEKSGTRKEDLLLHPDELGRIWSVRRALSATPPPEAMEAVIKRLKNTRSNTEFLLSVKDVSISS